MTSIFNNREIATIIWSIVFFGFVLSQKSVRETLRGGIEFFFGSRKIIIYFFLMLLYVTGVVAVLHLLGFWKLSLLKDTIVWFCFSGIALGVNSVTPKSGDDVFRDAIVDNAKAVVLIEFIANTYTFSLVGELVFVPVVALVVLLATVAKTQEEYSSVATIMDVLQVILGASVLIFAVKNAVVNYQGFLTLDTLREVLLPPLLSIAFLPFVYLALVFIRYETLFLNLEFGHEKSRSLKRYAKWKIFRCCRLRLKQVRQMLSEKSHDLRRIKSKDDVDRIIGRSENAQQNGT